jgi:hypothetical protein
MPSIRRSLAVFARVRVPLSHHPEENVIMKKSQVSWLVLGFAALIPLGGCSAQVGGEEEGVSSTTQQALGASNDHTVLILSSTVVPDTSPSGTPPKSVEQEAAEALGFSVELATPAQWAGKSAADFATYRAIILGDPSCSTDVGNISAAEANTGTWGPAIKGNVVVLGTDETFHVLAQTPPPADPRLVTQKGIQFATSSASTGAFVSLSCYYTFTTPSTPVPVLAPFANGGSFSVEGNLNCDPSMHNPGVGPASLNALTDPVLSNWSCSVHEGFNTFSPDFSVVAIDANHTSGLGVLSFPDGSTGLPYIIARAAAAPTCIEGTQSLDIRDRAVVTGTATTTTFSMGAESRLNGDGSVAGNADLRTRATVTGTLRVQGAVIRQPGVSIGTLINPASVSVPALPTKSFSVGSGTLNINSNTTLNPGNFGTVNVNTGTVTLNPGTYNFASLTVHAGVTLNFSSSSATVINVQGNLTLNQVRYNASNPALISWYSNASITVNSTQTPALPGSLLGPNGQVTIGPRNTINGCVQGRNVSIDADSRVNGI